MKTIRGKILFSTIGGMAALATIVCVISAWFSMQSTVKSTEKTLMQTVKVAASDVKAELMIYEAVAAETGSIPSLADSNSSVEVKSAVIQQRVERYGFARGNCVDTNGISPIDGLDVSEREYFQEALNGNTWISEPTVSKSTGEIVIMVSAPIWKNGDPNTGKIVGVVYFTQNIDMIINIVTDIKVGDTGTTYILDKNGVTIAHPNREVVEAFENSQEQEKTDPQLKKLAALEREMLAGKTGFGAYSYGGVDKFLAYSPIDIPSKWSIAISVGKSEFLQYTNQGVLAVAGISIALLAIFIGITFGVARKISNPITRVAKRLELVAQGDLHTVVDVEHTKDETQILSECMKATVDQLNAYMKAIGLMLEEIAKGNLAMEKPVVTFAGDFVQLEHAVDSIVAQLTETVFDMQHNSEEVSSGAEQVAMSAQSLSQGATEQASAVQELTATLQEISNQIHRSAESAQVAKDETDKTGAQVQQSNSKMKEMTAAMNDISQKSSEIGKIIKTIDDIAFQTNILSLNVAIEAARAGSAGKGFAVVADEVRTLASKSAQAARNTTALIEETVKAVDNGTQIADDTADALAQVIDSVQMVHSLIDDMSQASSYQAEAMSQLTEGIELISAVVQTNAATAEESAAASEELSGQASSLNSLVSRFEIK